MLRYDGINCLPVQNTCGVRNFYDVSIECVIEQLEAIFDDIIPDSIKIGMLFSAPIIEAVADFLKKHARTIPMVLDPVMIAKSGDALLLDDAVQTLKTKLLPLATILTPNLPEAHRLTAEMDNAENLAKMLLDLGPKAVLLKGGHAGGKYSNDLFLDQLGSKHWLKTKRIASNNTHGTGCTLSAAICACLALGYSLYDSCKIAKQYLTGAIQASKDSSVGKGHGPVNHLYQMDEISI